MVGINIRRIPDERADAGPGLVGCASASLRSRGRFASTSSLLEALDVAAAVTAAGQLDATLTALSSRAVSPPRSRKLMETYGFYEPFSMHDEGLAMWGTCAGAILVARR